MRVLVAVCAALAISASAAWAGDPVLLGMAGPTSNFIVSVNLAAVRTWPRAAEAFEQGKRSNPKWEQLVQSLGVDPLELVDELVIAGTVDNPSAKSSVDDAALLFKGRFDVPRLTELICRQGCNPETVGAYTLLRLPPDADSDGTPGGVAFFNSSYAALGKLDSVRRAARGFAPGGAPQLSPAMAGWAGNLSTYDIWIASSGPFHSVAAQDAEAMNPMAAGAMSKIAAFGLGIRLASDVDIALQVLSNSETEATQLREMAQGLVALAALNADPQQPGMTEFLKRVRLSQQGKLVLASMSAPQAEVDRAMEKVEAGAGTVTAEALSEPSAPPRPAREGDIIIIGGERPPEHIPLKRSNR